MNQNPLTPAPHQDNNRQQVHRLAVVFGHRGPLYNPNLSRPHTNGIAGGPATPAMRRQDNNSILGNFLHWVFVGNRPGAGLDAVPGQLIQSFNPTTKAGIANILSMGVGGPKGEDILGKWQPAGKFESYNAMHGSPLDRGVPREGPIRAGKSYNPSIQKMVGNAKGVGGYRQANPMDIIEAQRAELVKRLATRDQIKNFSNRANASRMVHKELGNKMGGSTLIPGGGQPMRDYIDSLSADGVPRAYKNGLSAYNDGNNILLSMLHEMLFGGANGLLKQPPKPTGGYPYGGGPFG